MNRIILLLVLAVLCAGCASGVTAKWPWSSQADEVIIRDFNDDDIVEPCLTTEEKIKRLRTLLCEDCDAVEPAGVNIPLDIKVTPTISPSSAAPAVQAEGYPKIIKKIVTTYEGGVPKTTDVTTDCR